MIRWTLVLCALLVPAVAQAQATTFYLDRLTMAGAPQDGIAVWRPRAGRRFFGQLGLGVSVNPLRIANHVDDLTWAEQLEGPPVGVQVIHYFNAGVEIHERVTVLAALPVALYQSGYPTAGPNAPAGLDDHVDLRSTAFMAPRIDVRGVVVRSHGVSAGASAALWLPIGNRYSFGVDRSFSGAIGLAGEYETQRFAVTLNAGVHFRPEAHLNELAIGHELTYGFGAYVPLRRATVRLGVEVFGSTGLLTPGELDTSPLEWNLNARWAFHPLYYAGLGAGTRLTGGYAPDFRGLLIAGGTAIP
jgi:hypothetical protein